MSAVDLRQIDGGSDPCRRGPATVDLDKNVINRHRTILRLFGGSASAYSVELPLRPNVAITPRLGLMWVKVKLRICG